MKLVYFHSNICGSLLQKLILMTWLIVPRGPKYASYLEICNVPIQLEGKRVKLGVLNSAMGAVVITLLNFTLDAELTLDVAIWQGEEGNFPSASPKAASLLAVSPF